MGVSSSGSQSSNGQGGIIRRKALYVSSSVPLPLKNQVQNQSYSNSPDILNDTGITANKTVTGIYDYDTNRLNNWDELSSNAKNNFMSLDRHMNLLNYQQSMSPPGTPAPPYNATPSYSTGSLSRNNVPSTNQYPLTSVPITIAQTNNNVTNSQVCVSPQIIATSPNIIATSPNILATSANILATSPSYIVINNNQNMEASPVLSPTNYNIVEGSNGRRLSNPARPASIQINGNYAIVEDNNGRRLSNASQPGSLQISNGNYNIVEDNNGRRLSNPAKPGSLQISNGNIYLQNTYSSSSNIYGSATSPPASPPPQNVMYSLPRNFNSSQNIPLSQSPKSQNLGGVQMFKKSHNIPPNQRYSLPVINNSYSVINPNVVTKSNTVDNYRSPMYQQKVNTIRQHNTLSLSESNTVRSTGNYGGLSINGQEYRGNNSPSVNSSPLLEATRNTTTRSRAKSNSFSVKIPDRKDSTCLVGSLNSSGSSFVLDNSKSNSNRNVNQTTNNSTSFVSNTSSQGSGKLNEYSHNRILPDNINDPITPRSDGPSTENVASQSIDIPASTRSSDSDSDSSFSSYRSSNYVMSVTQGDQTEFNYAEVHPRPPPYEHSFMDQDSYDMDNDHDLIFDLEHTTSIPRSNSDENKELMEGMPILFNNRRRSKERPLFDRELINNDTLTSSTAFSNLLDSYTKILNYYECDAKQQVSRKENDIVLSDTNVPTDSNIQISDDNIQIKDTNDTYVQRKESNKVKRNSGTLFGVDVEVEKEILKKRSTLKSKERVVADEILRKISISHAKSIKKEPSLVKKNSTKSGKNDDVDVSRENTLNKNNLSLASSKSPNNNSEENTVYIESQALQNMMIPEAEGIIAQPVQVLEKEQVVMKNTNSGKDEIDIGLDVFDRFYEECLKRIDIEETEGGEQKSTLKKNKKSKDTILSLDHNDSIIEFDDELKGNFLSGFLFSNFRSSPSIENIKNFLQGDSLTEEAHKSKGRKEQRKSETEETILQPSMPKKISEVKSVPVQKVGNCVNVSEKKEKSEVAVVEQLSQSSSELEETPKQEQKKVESVSKVVPRELVTESNSTVAKESKKKVKSKHPLPFIPTEQKKEDDTSVVEKTTTKKTQNSKAEVKEEVSKPKKEETIASELKDKSKPKEETKKIESKEGEVKEGENKKDGTINSSDSMKKIEVILKKNSDRGHRIILPQSISDINNENKNEEPFIPNKTEVKQLIDRNLSNSSSHNLDNTQFFWSSDVQANTEVHPSEIFNHSNSVPEKLLGTIPTRKKSFAESAYVITRDSISNDINGKPVIDPKNYIRYRRSRVIWEHYNNSYLQHRMMSWSSHAIIRSKTIGSCYIKPQHSPSVSVIKKDIPIRSHTTEGKIKPTGKGPVTNYYEFLTPSIEALKEDNEMLSKVVNDMIKRKESDPKTPEIEELTSTTEKKDEKEESVPSPEKEEKKEQEKPTDEVKLQPKKVQINEDNNQVVSAPNEEEIITQYIPSDSSLSYSKTIYEYTADEDLEKIVEENSKAKRSGWAIWWSNYASQEDANNRLKEQKQINEDNNKNLLRKIRHFGNKSKKNKKQKKKRSKESEEKSPQNAITPSARRDSLPVPKRQSSISRNKSKSHKKKQEKEKKEENEDEIPYTQTLIPSPLLSPQLHPAGQSKNKDKIEKSKLNNVIKSSSDSKTGNDEEDMGYSSDTSFSSISTVSSISSLSSINEQLGNQPDLLSLANNNSNSVKEIFQDHTSEFSDFASSPGSPLFSNVHKEFPSPKEYVAVEGFPSPSIPSSIPEELVLPTTEAEEPKEIFSERDLLAPDERDLLISSSPQEFDTTNNQIYDLANFMTSSSSGVSSSQPLLTPPSSTNSQVTFNYELDNEKFNALSRDLQKRMESIYLLQLSLQQQFEQISIQLQERQRTNESLLQEEMEAIKQENEWRQNCIQQQKIIKQKQMELQDKQRKLQMEQEILQQKQLQQQEIHRQEQQLQLQELQLSQLKLQLQLQEQIKEQLHCQQLQSIVTEPSSPYYNNAMASKLNYPEQDVGSNPFDEEINEMFRQSNYNPMEDIHKMEEDQVIPDERIDINALIEANYDSEDSFTNNSDYYYSDITSNSEFTDTTYESTGSEYSFNHFYNDRLHIYKPEDDIPYARFNPMVEKALYQLSWNKLSYSKRSLHQQVVIRNLMIYYFTLNMEGTGHSRKSSMRRHVPRLKGVGRKRSKTK